MLLWEFRKRKLMTNTLFLYAIDIELQMKIKILHNIPINL